MSQSSFEMPWRGAYELHAAVAWGVSVIAMMFIAAFSKFPTKPFLFMGAISLAFATWRAFQGMKLLNFKLSLAGRPFAYIAASKVIEFMREKPGTMWLGYGFDWLPLHTQRAYEMRKRALGDVLPPAWFLKLRGVDPDKMPHAVGEPWIHGVEPDEGHIRLPLSAREGHTIVFGTTGAGKTRMLETMVFQDILRGDTVFMVDPKGDKEAREVMERAAKLAGRPFVYFHPSFPSQSCRLDPLKNWSRTTEIASRISSLIPSESGGDTFTQFAWRSINQVTQGMIYVDERPNLMSIRRHIEGGPDHLTEKVLRAFLERNVPRWESLLAPLVKAAQPGGKLRPPSPQSTPELTAYVHYYLNELSGDMKDEVVDGLVSMTTHNREHLGKMLTSLVPLLTMLTAGELGRMLSPDAADINDPRPIYDTEKLINMRAVVYIGLDSLSDSTVGSAIGSILLADLAAVAGARYNYGAPKDERIQLYVDEANECTNMPLIQIMNKGRGAGLVVTLFAQTFPDFVVRMGNEPKARQILGNANNLFALRTKDKSTQEFIIETFGETYIKHLERSQGQGSKTEDGGMEFSANVSEKIKLEKVAVFPQELLGMLPNLQYVAFLSGGRIVKGRLPKILGDQ